MIDLSGFEKLAGPISNILARELRNPNLAPQLAREMRTLTEVGSLKLTQDIGRGIVEDGPEAQKQNLENVLFNKKPPKRVRRRRRNNPYHVKFAASPPKALPKVDKTGLRRAQEVPPSDNVTAPMRKAIETSKMPKESLKKIKGMTEQVYTGGNTASNIKNLIKADEIAFRKKLKKRLGPESKFRTSSFYR